MPPGLVQRCVARSIRLAAEGVRYCLVGGIVYLVDVLVFVAILQLAEHGHLVANVVGRFAGAATGFVLHRWFTFGATERGISGQAMGYVVVFFANLALSTALLGVGVDILGLPPVLTRLSVDVFLIVMTFLAFRFVVFRR